MASSPQKATAGRGALRIPLALLAGGLLALAGLALSVLFQQRFLDQFSLLPGLVSLLGLVLFFSRLLFSGWDAGLRHGVGAAALIGLASCGLAAAVALLHSQLAAALVLAVAAPLSVSLTVTAALLLTILCAVPPPRSSLIGLAAAALALGAVLLSPLVNGGALALLLIEGVVALPAALITGRWAAGGDARYRDARRLHRQWFEAAEPPKRPDPPARARRVFIGHTTADAGYAAELARHLQPLTEGPSPVFTLWYPGAAPAGSEVHDRLDEIRSADVILMLLTSRYQSDPAFEQDRRCAMARRERGATLIPVRLAPVLLDPELESLTPLPRDGRAVSQYGPDEDSRAPAWLDVVAAARAAREVPR